MMLLFKLLFIAAFVFMYAMVLLKLVMALKEASRGRRESDRTKMKTGRMKSLNYIVALLLLSVITWFVFSEFVSLQF
jgi:hypothetical protein